MRVDRDDVLIPAGHQARTLWSVIEKLDLSAFHEPIKARDGICGRDVTDPRLLVSVWLYAATRGVIRLGPARNQPKEYQPKPSDSAAQAQWRQRVKPSSPT